MILRFQSEDFYWLTRHTFLRLANDSYQTLKIDKNKIMYYFFVIFTTKSIQH
jgi:hypothetical protein